MNFDEYEREGIAAYAMLAETFATILRAAISIEGGYRLQQINERAKQPTSLQKKLHKLGLEATDSLEETVRDLAGCRVIFYTNSDVTRFINSGIVEDNFEVIDVKIHHPRREAEDANELYISNHYLVRLRAERLAMPEYARFSGMKCEIQIQTILNHAWAEMAHDTIYKAPTITDIGGRALDSIKLRLKKVARKYLVPAGYEFQMIAHDFQRLIEGKQLFEGKALEAVVEANDNNVRANALETLAENVLPLYDDLQAVYPEVVRQLVTAAAVARQTPPVAIETPYGSLPAKTYADIVKSITSILNRHRYLDVEATFDALRKLDGLVTSEDERKPLLELGKALAKHELNVWRQHGPVVQQILLKEMEAISEDELRASATLLRVMLGAILGTEVSGTTNNSSSVIIHRGSVVASDALRDVRTRAVELLKRQFLLVDIGVEQQAILRTLQAAASLPSGAGYSNALAKLVMDDTSAIIEFMCDAVPTLCFEFIQKAEAWVNRCYWRHAELPPAMRGDQSLEFAREKVQAVALDFRNIVNADEDFVVYKTLVGFESVYPPAWEDRPFGYREAEAYRANQVDGLIASVDEISAASWFERISRYAHTDPSDAATFPVFGQFLERLAEVQPTIVLGYIDQIEGPIEDFLPAMLKGLMRSSESAQTTARINAWITEGKHCGRIAWYLRSADTFDEDLLRCTLFSAIKHNDRRAVRNALVAATDQFDVRSGRVVDDVFLPALSFLAATSDFSWLRMPWCSWLDRPLIRSLNEQQAGVVLNTLLPYPELEGSAEYVVATIAERWPSLVIDFIGKRQVFARSDAAPQPYDAVPFAVHQLQPPLAAVPDLIVAGARNWFEANPHTFTFDGGKLLASVFPSLTNGLKERIAAIIAEGDEANLNFALGVLRAFEGEECVYELVREIVAAVESESPLLDKARDVLSESGMVRGEFGFVELLTERKALIQPWLNDPSETVKIFSADWNRKLELRIAAETRSAEASVALRKLQYGEELDNNEKTPE